MLSRRHPSAFGGGSIRVCGVALALVLLATDAMAQDDGAWSAHTSMRPVEQVLYHGGEVWCATGGGVLRYDPETAEYGRLTRLQGLAGNRVLSIAVDGAGDLWFGTEGMGLSRLRQGQTRFDPPVLAFAGLAAKALVAVGHHLFVGTELGISLFLADELVVSESYQQLGDFPRNTAVHSLVTAGGVLWAATDEGVAWADLSSPNLLDPDRWDTWAHTAAVEDVLTVGGLVLAATETGLFRFQPESGSFLRDNASSASFTSLGVWQGLPMAASAGGELFQRVKDGQWRRLALGFGKIRGMSRNAGPLWIGTQTGLTSHGSPAPPAPQEPPGNQFYEMAKAADGSLWMASVPNDRVTPALGLYRFSETRWETIDGSSGLPSDVAISLAVGPEDRMWVGTWGHGLAVGDERGGWQTRTWFNSELWGIRDDNTFVVVSDIQRDADGLMWMTNVQAGLVVMDGFPPRQSRRYTQQELGLGERRDIGRFAISPSGLKWISTAKDGFLLFDDGGTPFASGDEVVVHVNTLNEQRLSSDRVRDVLVEGETKLWVATDNGLNEAEVRYDRAAGQLQILSWKVHRSTDGLPSDEINDLESDAIGNLWIATASGLARLAAGGEVTVHTAAGGGLIDDRVESLLYDEQENAMWIGTRRGLSRLQLAEMEEPDASRSQVTFYPNPFIPAAGAPLTFADVAPGSVLRIHTVAGELVIELTAESPGDRITWEGLNSAGFVV
ncbi:MAG: hypothetical protein HOH74_16030, partial [Gemmatimonadetes bacterium]|nr:hypothetical protein [Gemmatimonadota bacterium]